MTEQPRYPDISVPLNDEDSDLMALGRILTALKNAGISRAQIDEFTDEATSGDRAHMLDAARTWVRLIG